MRRRYLKVGLRALLGAVALGACALQALAEERLSSLQGIEVEEQGGTWLVLIEGTKAPDFTSYTERDPFRVVVDWAGSRLEGSPIRRSFSRGPIRKVTAHQFEAEAERVTRLEIELEQESLYRVEARGNRVAVLLTLEPASEPRPVVAALETPPSQHPVPASTKELVPPKEPEGPLTEPDEPVPSAVPQVVVAVAPRVDAVPLSAMSARTEKKAGEAAELAVASPPRKLESNHRRPEEPLAVPRGAEVANQPLRAERSLPAASAPKAIGVKELESSARTASAGVEDSKGVPVRAETDPRDSIAAAQPSDGKSVEASASLPEPTAEKNVRPAVSNASQAAVAEASRARSDESAQAPALPKLLDVANARPAASSPARVAATAVVASKPAIAQTSPASSETNSSLPLGSSESRLNRPSMQVASLQTAPAGAQPEKPRVLDVGSQGTEVVRAEVGNSAAKDLLASGAASAQKVPGVTTSKASVRPSSETLTVEPLRLATQSKITPADTDTAGPKRTQSTPEISSAIKARPMISTDESAGTSAAGTGSTMASTARAEPSLAGARASLPSLVGSESQPSREGSANTAAAPTESKPTLASKAMVSKAAAALEKSEALVVGEKDVTTTATAEKKSEALVVGEKKVTTTASAEKKSEASDIVEKAASKPAVLLAKTESGNSKPVLASFAPASVEEETSKSRSTRLESASKSEARAGPEPEEPKQRSLEAEASRAAVVLSEPKRPSAAEAVSKRLSSTHLPSSKPSAGLAGLNSSKPLVPLTPVEKTAEVGRVSAATPRMGTKESGSAATSSESKKNAPEPRADMSAAVSRPEVSSETSAARPSPEVATVPEPAPAASVTKLADDRRLATFTPSAKPSSASAPQRLAGFQPAPGAAPASAAPKVLASNQPRRSSVEEERVERGVTPDETVGDTDTEAGTTRVRKSLGSAVAQESAATNDGPRAMTYIGFQQMANVSRVFVRLDGEAPYRVSRQGDRVFLLLANTGVPLKNNTRALDTTYFDSPVMRVQATPLGADTRIEILLRENAPYTVKRIGTTVALDFSQGP